MTQDDRRGESLTS